MGSTNISKQRHALEASWSAEDFAAHVAWAERDGSSTQNRDLSGLFLTGAAGRRIGSAWSAIESSHGEQARRTLRQLPKADEDPDDLWSETLARLMENAPEPNEAQTPAINAGISTLPDGRRPARIIRFRGRVTLMQYLLTVAKRLAVSRHRKRKPALGWSEATGPIVDPQQHRPDEVLTTLEQAGVVEQAVRTACGTLNAEQRLALVLVVGRGWSQTQTAQRLGWTESKVSRRLRQSRQAIKAAVSDDARPVNAAELEAWQTAWEKIWRSVQDAPDSASEST